jgi:hypothetical protein
MYKYIYIGTEEIDLMGFGRFKTNDKIKSLTPINHPLFIREEEEVKYKMPKKNTKK